MEFNGTLRPIIISLIHKGVENPEKHRGLLKYMAKAGTTYHMKRKMLSEFIEKFTALRESAGVFNEEASHTFEEGD